MKSNQTLKLISRFDDEILVDIHRDLPEIEAYIKQTLKTALNYPYFKELKVAFSLEALTPKLVTLLAPTINPDKLYLQVMITDLDEAFDDQTVYIRWCYHHVDGIVYQTKDYQDINKIIKVDTLLTS